MSTNRPAYKSMKVCYGYSNALNRRHVVIIDVLNRIDNVVDNTSGGAYSLNHEQHKSLRSFISRVFELQSSGMSIDEHHKIILKDEKGEYDYELKIHIHGFQHDLALEISRE